ncbi:kelch protein 40b [Biomphalaria glabrata]|nr:kelch protein 40b [Biomphalaria glabrata]
MAYFMEIPPPTPRPELQLAEVDLELEVEVEGEAAASSSPPPRSPTTPASTSSWLRLSQRPHQPVSRVIKPPAFDFGSESPEILVADLKTEINMKLRKGVFKCFGRGPTREMFCDFIVTIEDQEFPCHRFILNACSGFFEAMLRSGMKETQELKARVHGISPNIFKLILDVIYTGSNVLTLENMIDVWKGAHQLQIEFLIEICETFILRNMNSENCFMIYKYAQLLDAAKVNHHVLIYLTRNFITVVQNDKFLKLKYEELLQILKHPLLPVCADFQVEAILKWCTPTGKYNKDYHKRLANLGNLIQVVNMAKVSTQCLSALLTNNFIQGNRRAVAAINCQAAKVIQKPDPHNTFAEDNLNLIDRLDEPNCFYTLGLICQHCMKKQHNLTMGMPKFMNTSMVS